MVSATADGQSKRGRRGNRHGRVGGITPKYVNPEQVVRITPDLVEVGHLLHDGLVVGIEKRYSEETGEPVEFYLDTPHCLVYVQPDEEVCVYGRIAPDAAVALGEQYKTGATR